MHLLKCEPCFSSHLCLPCPSPVSVQAVDWEAQQAAHSSFHELQDKNHRSEHTNEYQITLRGDKDFLCSSWGKDPHVLPRLIQMPHKSTKPITWLKIFSYCIYLFLPSSPITGEHTEPLSSAMVPLSHFHQVMWKPWGSLGGDMGPNSCTTTQLFPSLLPQSFTLRTVELLRAILVNFRSFFVQV